MAADNEPGRPGIGKVGIAAAASFISTQTMISPIWTPPMIGVPGVQTGIIFSSSPMSFTLFNLS